ncbi:MAG: stage II sporulation protein M [Herpetosiphonaceae bacterium]|nr:stage II sporulation protein M [Herpetosiphonaceae bacterium]
MAASSLTTITRRDVRDAFSDWRTVIPLIVLSLFLPLILRTGIRIASDFLDEETLTRSLIPLGLLITGFLPASFSLIGPLETFVGERERNTLEALLSAPISDRGLYMGKFVAALTPPLLSSGLAMLMYSVATKLARQDLAAYLTLPWIAAIVVMILIKSVAMVAAAVYISSKATSIRSANLLASFVLIPMTVVVQVEALMVINNNLLVVALINVALIGVAGAFLLQGMRSFNREEILAREHRGVANEGQALRGQLSDRRYGPMITIARREVTDTLTDWRILTPIAVLTLLVPIMAFGGVVFAYHNLPDPVGVIRLMPFILLLVGFLPASFSLIVALEVFVGEKERGSLESLFSMPISDGQLYRGKLLAAFLPPVSAGLIALLLFYGGLAIFGNAALLEPITLAIFGEMLFVSTMQALAMVAAAVVISSHTSSVRVANLLASFILVPITILIQLEAILIIGERYDVTRMVGLAMLMLALVLARSGMGSFNRESILSREHLSLNWGAIWGAFAAFFREIRPAGVDPDKLAPQLSVRRFYREELPVVWREIRLALLLVSGAVLAAVVVGSFFVPSSDRDRELMNVLVPTQNIGQLNEVPSFLAIFARNSRNIFLNGIFAVFTFGLSTLLVPLIAFFSVSYGATWAANNAATGGGLGFVLGYVLPHGLIELPAAMLAAALGLRIAASYVKVPPTYSVGRHLLWALAVYLKMFVFVILPLLLLASIIEVTITPAVFRAVYGG